MPVYVYDILAYSGRYHIVILLFYGSGRLGLGTRASSILSKVERVTPSPKPQDARCEMRCAMPWLDSWQVFSDANHSNQYEWPVWPEKWDITGLDCIWWRI